MACANCHSCGKLIDPVRTIPGLMQEFYYCDECSRFKTPRAGEMEHALKTLVKSSPRGRDIAEHVAREVAKSPLLQGFAAHHSNVAEAAFIDGIVLGLQIAKLRTAADA